jgi:hypothetical protein
METIIIVPVLFFDTAWEEYQKSSRDIPFSDFMLSKYNLQKIVYCVDGKAEFVFHNSEDALTFKLKYSL